MFFFKFSSFFRLYISLLLHFYVIFNCFIDCFFKKARLVYEGNGHVTTKFWNLPIVHLRLSNHFLYKFMLVSRKNVFLNFFFLLFIFIIWFFFFFYLCKKFICNSLILTQNFSNHNIFMAFIGIFKFDNNWSIIFYMGFFIIIIIDWLHLLLNLTYIYAICSDI